MMTTDLKLGSTVRLRSGGFPMTVMAINHATGVAIRTYGGHPSRPAEQLPASLLVKSVRLQTSPAVQPRRPF